MRSIEHIRVGRNPREQATKPAPPESLAAQVEYMTRYQEQKQRVEQRLGVPVEVHVSKGRLSMTTQPPPGEVRRIAGSFLYSHDNETQELLVDDMLTEEWAQGNGVSTALLARALTLHPGTRRIHSVLGGTNMELFTRLVHEGMPATEAVQQTPLYRTQKSLGFTESVSFDGEELIVQRPEESIQQTSTIAA
jgi:hypothetical protein